MPTRSLLRLLPNVSSLAILALLAANYFSTFGDLDYTWQIRTGAIIVRTGDIRPPDHFTYTIAGQDVPDFEWIYETALWLLWDNLGYGGLKLLKTLLVAATLLLVAWRLRVAKMRWHGVALALTLAVAILAPAWNLRALFCTTLGLLAVSGWLHDHCTGRKPLTWWLPFVMLIWANCHPAVIIGQALVVGAIGWEWANRWLKLNAPLDTAALKRLTLISGVALAATLLGSDPMERLLYPFKPQLTHPIHKVFVEMQPLHATLAKPPYTSGLVYVVAAFVAGSIVLRFRRYRGWEIMLLVGLAALGSTAARAAQDWLLVMLALGMPHIVALFRQAALKDRRRRLVALALHCDSAWKRLWNAPLLRWQGRWIMAMVMVLAIVSLIPSISKRMPKQDDPDWPTGALAFLQEQGIHGNFFAPPDYGAYLTWRLGDNAHCYADTRGFFMPPLLLEDSHVVPQLGPDWRTRLERVMNHYPTEFFVLETTGPRGELWRRLQPLVGSEALYVDQQTVILRADTVRRGVRQMDVLAQR